MAFLVIRLNIPAILEYDNLQLLMLFFFLFYSKEKKVYWRLTVPVLFVLFGELALFGEKYWQWAVIFCSSSLLMVVITYLARQKSYFLMWLGSVSVGVFFWSLELLVASVSFSEFIYGLTLYVALSSFLFIIIIFESHYRKQIIENKRLAMFDEMTDTKNYRSFVKEFGQSLQLAGEQQKPIAFIMLDIDHFKLINDTYGHLSGNQVLKFVAVDLINNTYDFDSQADVYRLGGEEFGIFLTNTNLAETQKFAQKCRYSLSQLAVPIDNGMLHLTASFGCDISRTGDDFNTFYQRVDHYLYQAKINGGNNVNNF
ncbi:GGDEF domain-containing protein [Ligilactobacillus acidipiscis]|uniref:GGDEF domain-containing protein n=1 Tax=Ligilactobacillus acidipiscis TaxID=89059 RepID=UPI003865E1EC